MAKPKLCDPSSLSVLIPYKDLEQLMVYATTFERIEQEFEKLQKRVTSLHGLYMETLEALNKVYDLL